MPEPATSSVRPITIEDRLGTYRKEHGRHGMVGLSEPMLRMYRLLERRWLQKQSTIFMETELKCHLSP
ncbi:hypothetical protein HYX06_05125 [Candidatus Woesearchaeota archaeon]|nr:hypothetical protein [Candidatus Woesearchaeota archaeon]